VSILIRLSSAQRAKGGSPMSSDPPELGKGLFGYRKSAVNQILSDRDLMLRQAEGRVRQAESKVGELENELNQMRTRNTRMDEQLERLRNQLDALTRRAESAFGAADASATWEAAAADAESPAGTVQEEPSQGPSSLDETVEPAEEDLSYGFEMPDAEPAESELTAYGVEAPEAGADYEAAQAEPQTYWSESDQVPQIQMETGPDYAEPEPGMELDEAGAPEAEAPAYEPPQFAYGGEQAISEPEQFAYEGEQARAQPDMDSFTYTPEVGAPYEAPVGTDEQQEEPVEFDPAMSGGYEPTDLQAMDAEEEDTATEEPAPYQPAEYQPAVQNTPQEPPRPREEPAPYQPAEYQPAPVQYARQEQPRPTPQSEAVETTSRFVTEEIAGVLSAAEESAGRILERARVQAEQQIGKSSRLWEEVRAEVARLASWREGIDPVIQTVMTKVEGIRTQIEDVPERIRDALAPMADSISGIDNDLAELAEACSPPLLLAPRELESDEAEGAAEWEGSRDHEDHSTGRRNVG
jgi:archaellum component FlaC